jgi:phenylacetate-CoA ligase
MIPGKGIYDSLPVWAQSLAVNWRSTRGFKAKYGGLFHEQMARLAANESKSRDQLLTEQQQALRTLLEYVRKHVPYYRRLNAPPDDFSAWPILEKKTVAANPRDFLSDEFKFGDLMESHTSGTTGTPLTVWFTKEYHQTEMAFRWRHKAWAGVPFLSSGAYVAGHPVVPPTQTKPPFWRWDKVEKRLLMSSYHLTPQNLPVYAEAFQKYRPDFIHGYPSSLYLLGGYKPKAVFTASETLLDFQRVAIEQAFGAKVFNWYGNTEMTSNIVADAEGNLRQRTDYGVLELLDDGTMICTGLNNRAMPLIRYRVGDRAVAKPGGTGFPLIGRIEGRVEDYVRTPDGRQVGRLDHLFKDVQHVREAQIVQKRLDEIVCRVVRADGFNDGDEQIVRREARQRLGEGVAVRFEFVEEIARTKNGKFRFIVSEL